MKTSWKLLSVTAVLAAVIPLTAYADSIISSDKTDTSKDGTSMAQRLAGKMGMGMRGKMGAVSHMGMGMENGPIGQEVLDLLKLDRQTFEDKHSKGETLAQIAQDQGVSRDDLKKTMISSFNQAMDKQKANFEQNIDKMLDAIPQDKPMKEGGFAGKGMMGGMKGGMHGDMKAGMHGKGGMQMDLTDAAGVLGLSNADLKKELAAGKSLADLAKEKGVDVQKLIDAQVSAMVKILDQELKDGKITQDEYNTRKEQCATMAAKMINK